MGQFRYIEGNYTFKSIDRSSSCVRNCLAFKRSQLRFLDCSVRYWEEVITGSLAAQTISKNWKQCFFPQVHHKKWSWLEDAFLMHHKFLFIQMAEGTYLRYDWLKIAKRLVLWTRWSPTTERDSAVWANHDEDGFRPAIGLVENWEGVKGSELNFIESSIR